MTETEPHAPHIDGLAYSEEVYEVQPPTGYWDPAVVDYPQRDPFRRSWIEVSSAALIGLALTAIIAAVFILWNRPQSTTNETPRAEPTVTVTPPPSPSSPPPSSPPPVVAPPPTLKTTEPRDPDAVFTSTWADEMPNYPFTDEFCTSHGADTGCWPELSQTGRTHILPVARSMCALVAQQSKSYAIGVLLHDRAESTDPFVHAMTAAQAYEFVQLSVHAYCPEYENRS